MDTESLLGLAIGGPIAFVVVTLILWGMWSFVVYPREAHVLLYYGKISRTVTTPGLHFAFPIGLTRHVVSTKDLTFSTPVTTVVDVHGNPIQVSAVCIYRVVDAARALIDVDGYQHFVLSQLSTVLKAVSSHFPYESGDPGRPCLKKESREILHALTGQLQAQVNNAGIQVLLVRLNDLSYAPEIAQSMLLRQQAQALVDSRRTLVEGAVGMVKEALDQLEQTGIRFGGARRARLAGSLTLLLCAGEREQHSTVVSRARH